MKRLWMALNSGSIQNLFFVLIGAAILAVVLESEASLRIPYAPWFDTFEVFCLVMFSGEYLMRFVSCPESPNYHGRWGRLRWMVSFEAIVDLLAILPGLLLLGSVDLRVLRAVRLLRILRLVRCSRGVRMLVDTFRASARQLAATLSAVAVLGLIAASLLYFAERDAQPEVFRSIPAALWWSVCTLTTVGYGDIYPITFLGKLFAALLAITGVGVFALPAGIVAANLQQVLAQERVICPYCGRDIHEKDDCSDI